MAPRLDDSRRRAYLHAMGIDLWVPRAAAPQPATATATAAAATVAAPTPSPEPGEPPPPAVPAVVPGPARAGSAPPEADAAWEPVWEPQWEPVWEPPGEMPGEMPGEIQAQPIPPSAPPAPRRARPPSPRPAAAHPTPVARAAPAPAPEPADLLADPAMLDWDGLAAAVADCRACALCESRTRTVFGVGDRRARLLVIGEAPGADEDRAGEPFVGRAGQLLNQMLAAIGLARGQVYIANILKCRPPGNRNPHPGEVAHCQGYLARQVELIQPRVILSVGAVSAQNLLGTDTPVGRLRGRWFDYGPAAVPLRVTYHPAYLLRSPEHKGKAWEDLIEVARRLGSDR